MLINNNSKITAKTLQLHTRLSYFSLITSRDPLLLHHTYILTYKYTTVETPLGVLYQPFL